MPKVLTLRRCRDRSRSTIIYRVRGYHGRVAGEVHDDVKPFTTSASCSGNEDEERGSPIYRFGNFASCPTCCECGHGDCTMLLRRCREGGVWRGLERGVEKCAPNLVSAAHRHLHSCRTILTELFVEHSFQLVIPFRISPSDALLIANFEAATRGVTRMWRGCRPTTFYRSSLSRQHGKGLKRPNT